MHEGETCLGSREPAVEHRTATDLASPWTGVCPACLGRFELLYAGLLPDHAAVPETERETAD
jgi:hypothetical protein